MERRLVGLFLVFFIRNSVCQIVPGRVCPPGIEIANCFVEPCLGSTCPGVPNAVCRDNYCGGCHAKWFIKVGNSEVEVTNQC